MLPDKIRMKNCLLIVSLMMCVSMNAQDKKTVQVLANSRLLESTVFGTKDSATLESLFAKPLIYIHSHGNVQNREQAIHSISNNKSTYVKSDKTFEYGVEPKDDSLVVTHRFEAIEKKIDGTESQLNFTITLVWAKEKGKWKLFRRQAIQNH